MKETIEIIPKKHKFSEKDSFVHYLSYANLVSYVAIQGAVLWKLLCRDIFGKFQALMNTWALINERKL